MPRAAWRSIARPTSNLKYHVEAIDLAELAQLAGQTGVDGSADARRHGHRQRRVAADDGHARRQQRRLRREQGARSQQQVHRHRAGSERRSRSQVEADTNATFVKAGALQLNAVTAKTTYSGDRLQFTTNIKEEKRELDATGELILHPDHQEVHLPQLAVRTQGIEWRTAPGAEATVQYGQDRVQLDNVRLVERRSGADVNGAFALQGESPAGAIKVQARNVDLQQLETLLLMNRGFSGKLSADATISGTAEAPVVDGHVEVANGAFQTYKYQSLTADVDYTGDAHRCSTPTLQQSPTEAITAKGSVPMSLFKPRHRRARRRVRGGHGRPPRQVHGAEPRHRPGLHDAGHQRDRDARGRRPRHRLGPGPAPAGVRRHQGRRVRRSGRRRVVHAASTRGSISSPTRSGCRSSRFSTSTASR